MTLAACTAALFGSAMPAAAPRTEESDSSPLRALVVAPRISAGALLGASALAASAGDLFLPMPPRHHGWPGRGLGTRSRRSARLRRGSRARRHAAKRANRSRS